MVRMKMVVPPLVCVLMLAGIIEGTSQGVWTGQCVVDTPSRFYDYFFSISQISIELCIAGCSSQGYLFAAVQDGWACSCGNTAPPKSIFAPSSECNKACKGDASQICGGVWRMNVYSTEKWTDGGEVIFTGDISSVEGSGLPNSVFPGTDSETVCSQTTCDPQISELYKNASFIVAENIQRIDIINKEKDISWVAVANTFLAVSYSEVQAYRMGEIPPTREERRQTPARNMARQLFLDSMERKRKDQVNFPSSLQVFTTDANNQGECSSCAAFAVTAALEICIQKVIPNIASWQSGLSSQNMLDCAFGSPGVFGCDGGQSFRYLKWLENATLDTNRQYPYLDSSIRFEGLNNAYRTCYKSGRTSAAVMEESHSSWDNHTERDLENILLEGHAIITTIDVQEDLMFYEAGVYQSSKCQDWSLGSDRDFQWEEGSDFRPLRHAVVIVGLGLENGQKYWKVKNSWGENWGSSGFFKIIRNGSAHCGLGSYFSVALCKKCTSGNNCETKNQGPVQPMRRPPPNLPKEGVSDAFTSHLATPLGGVGLTTCSTCAGLSECPEKVPCRTMDKCCTLQGGSGIRLYCPSIC